MFINHYEILHATAATRLIETDSGSYILKNNAVALMKPNTTHSTSFIEHIPHERFILNFTEEFISPFTTLLNIDLDELFKYKVREYFPNQIKNIRRILNLIYEDSKANTTTVKNTMLLLHTIELFVLLNEGSETFPLERRSGNIYEITQYINQNFLEDISLSLVADNFFMNKSQLCRKLKKHYGKTFSEIVNELRILHAAELLKSTSMTVSKISAECGYANFTYFMRQFKKIIGVTPARYRKDEKNEKN